MTTISYLSILKEGSLKQQLLTYFFLRPHAEHYLRELALLLQVDPANLSRDLMKLEKEGLFKSRMRGNQKHFSLNTQYPFYEELKKMVQWKAPATWKPAHPPRHNVYIIAGSNGAGKTTFATKFLPDVLDCTHFINADLIARGVSPLAPDEAAIKAGKLLLSEIREASLKKIDFGFETTLAGRSYVRLLQDLRSQYYAVHLFFLWIPNVEMSLKRIQERVSRGGHHIPSSDARRRFRRGLRNLFELYAPLLTSWAIFDNSTMVPELIAFEERGQQHIMKEDLFTNIRKQAGVR